MTVALFIVLVVSAVLAVAWFKLRGPDIPYAALETTYADSSSRFVDLPGDLHVHYQLHGARELPVLLLLHGYGDSYTSWEGWVRVLEDRFHLISVDFPGHGLTRAPVDYRLDLVRLADFVDRFAAELRLPEFALVGNSMGGGVAWQFALRYPQRIRALILVSAVGFANDKPPGAAPLAFKILRHAWGRALLRNIDNRPLIDAGLKFDVYDERLVTPARVDRWAALQRAPGHRAILMSLDLSTLAQTSALALHAIDVPTLILQGDADPLIEAASGRKFRDAIPGARLIAYPQVGHLPQIEIPERSAADVGEFLQDAPVS